MKIYLIFDFYDFDFLMILKFDFYFEFIKYKVFIMCVLKC